MNLSPIDAQLQGQFPTVMVPIYSTLDGLDRNGHRFLMAKNGLWMEVKRSYLHAVIPVINQIPCVVPYGQVEKSLSILPIASQLIREFKNYAATVLPFECAGRILLHKPTGTMRLEILKATSVSPSHVEYQIPTLSVDEEMVLDIHSHGNFNAFFSSRDDEDDRSEVKIAGVIGNPARNERWEACFRLCLNGLFFPLKVNVENDHYLFSFGEVVNETPHS
ncbi:PRTRC system protein A [Undibacterium oligocarboniphilum]|uniref:PRTRC system protein A n=1 Tax=Undibacterium oligocarboniphilum TaxID=666702 RepID=A0A850QIL1_9BURK|nr:PRTRC system protein A [Undibacterium oligocarboniphilum]MBC3871775.1 PRTRC system protein A [Undibacterium oligocarboniphilum]NVO79411.1 PRTRC system protein A [Undibacterium oligocarboniphilum]